MVFGESLLGTYFLEICPKKDCWKILSCSAHMVELVDTRALKAGDFGRESSILSVGIFMNNIFLSFSVVVRR